jgi:anthranilate synthase component 1
MDFEGNFNHAIMIRTFWVRITNYTLKQEPESLPDQTKKAKWKVYNKLRALNKALDLETILKNEFKDLIFFSI